MNSQIINGECLEEIKKLDDDSVDLVCTDPPYGYSFMGKNWDKAVPSVDIWKECLRVLKPGAFCFVMSAPRSDVQNAMISRLMEAGFRLDFTPIYWTYASGFPKAGNIGKLVDKRLGVERKVVSVEHKTPPATNNYGNYGDDHEVKRTVASSAAAKALDGSYAGFQPKPAVEVIIVAMKPLSEKTYVDQALKNGKGITWLDNCRIPYTSDNDIKNATYGNATSVQHTDQKYGIKPMGKTVKANIDGRFPANLLVSDDVLNDGQVTKSGQNNIRRQEGKFVEHSLGGAGLEQKSHADSGSYSRYFDLDKWASTLPFLITPKASKSEKNKGLDDFEEKAKSPDYRQPTGNAMVDRIHGLTVKKNHHPTVKPLKLMSYLITLGSREGDTILDPFVGSGTTILAAEKLKRKGIGIEREVEYAKIAQARLKYVDDELKNKLEQTELL